MTGPRECEYPGLARQAEMSEKQASLLPSIAGSGKGMSGAAGGGRFFRYPAFGTALERDAGLAAAHYP